MFHYFTIKFHFSFFASFRLFSLQIFRFASLEQSEAKFKYIFSFFSLFFAFFRIFFTFFRLIFVSLRFFHLIFAYFTFVFASDFWCFASKWIMWNQAFFSLPSETKFSLQFQISLPKRKWGRTLVSALLNFLFKNIIQLLLQFLDMKRIISWYVLIISVI